MPTRPWLPTDATSVTIQGWYRTIDPNGVVAVGADVISAGAVTNWTDRSGQGRTLFKEGTPTVNTTGFGTGRPTIVGGGSNGFRTSTSLPFPTGAVHGAMAIGNIAASVSDYYRLVGFNTQYNADVFDQGIVPLMKMQYADAISYFYSFANSTSAFTLGTAALLEGYPTSTTTGRSGVNAVAASSDITFDMVGKTMERMGFMVTSSGASEGFQFEAAEEVNWTGVISSGDLAKMQGYLAWNNGKQSLLPSGHAYELAAPTVSTGGTAYTLTAAAGAFAVTGKAAILSPARRLIAAPGGFSVTGRAAGLAVGRKVQVTFGAFVLTGQPANLRFARRLSAATGVFNVTGQPAGLIAPRRVIAATGAFVVTGRAASLSVARRMSLTAGSFTFSGKAAGLTVGRRMSVQPAAFQVTTYSANLLKTGDVIPTDDGKRGSPLLNPGLSEHVDRAFTGRAA